MRIFTTYAVALIQTVLQPLYFELRLLASIGVNAEALNMKI